MVLMNYDCGGGESSDTRWGGVVEVVDLIGVRDLGLFGKMRR